MTGATALIDPASAQLISDEALDLVTDLRWPVHVLPDDAGRARRILVHEPCVACQFIREQLFERSAYDIGFYSSYLDPHDLSLHCAFRNAPVPCPAAEPGGLPRELWVRRYVLQDHGDEIDLLAGGR